MTSYLYVIRSRVLSIVYYTLPKQVIKYYRLDILSKIKYKHDILE